MNYHFFQEDDFPKGFSLLVNFTLSVWWNQSGTLLLLPPPQMCPHTPLPKCNPHPSPQMCLPPSPSAFTHTPRAAASPWNLSHPLTPKHPMLRPTCRQPAKHSSSAVPGGGWDLSTNCGAQVCFRIQNFWIFESVHSAYALNYVKSQWGLVRYQ